MVIVHIRQAGSCQLASLFFRVSRPAAQVKLRWPWNRNTRSPALPLIRGCSWRIRAGAAPGGARLPDGAAGTWRMRGSR
jgi:hypothetical protein